MGNARTAHAKKAAHLKALKGAKAAGIEKARRAKDGRGKDFETHAGKVRRAARVDHAAAVQDGLTRPEFREEALCGKVGRLAKPETAAVNISPVDINIEPYRDDSTLLYRAHVLVTSLNLAD